MYELSEDLVDVAVIVLQGYSIQNINVSLKTNR